MTLEQNELVLSRRSFLGWTAKIGIIAVTTKIIPASLDDLEVIKCNVTAMEVSNAHLIRAELWSKELRRILLEDFDEWHHKIGTRQEIF